MCALFITVPYGTSQSPSTGCRQRLQKYIYGIHYDDCVTAVESNPLRHRDGVDAHDPGLRTALPAPPATIHAPAAAPPQQLLLLLVPVLAAPAAAPAGGRAPAPRPRGRAQLAGTAEQEVPRVRLALGPQRHRQVAQARDRGGVVLAEGVLADLEGPPVQLLRLG